MRQGAFGNCAGLESNAQVSREARTVRHAIVIGQKKEKEKIKIKRKIKRKRKKGKNVHLAQSFCLVLLLLERDALVLRHCLGKQRVREHTL